MTTRRLFLPLELREPPASGAELFAKPQDDLDSRPVDLELAIQRTSHEHALDVDMDDIPVVASNDFAFVDEKCDQLVIAIDELE